MYLHCYPKTTTWETKSAVLVKGFLLLGLFCKSHCLGPSQSKYSCMQDLGFSFVRQELDLHLGVGPRVHSSRCSVVTCLGVLRIVQMRGREFVSIGNLSLHPYFSDNKVHCKVTKD
jgi:hypothetical protein